MGTGALQPQRMRVAVCRGQVKGFCFGLHQGREDVMQIDLRIRAIGPPHPPNRLRPPRPEESKFPEMPSTLFVYQDTANLT